MKALPFNSAIFNTLKRQYKILLSIIPVSLLGIGTAIPVMIDNMPSISSTGFTLLAPLILLFYLTGWGLNGFIARWCLHWSSKKTFDVFLCSKVPNKWHKKGGKDDYDKQIIQAMKKWQEERKTGVMSFIFLVGGLRIGGTAYAVITACLYYNGLYLDLFYFLSQGLLWILFGFAGGLFIWINTEKDYVSFCKHNKVSQTQKS